MLPFKPVSEVSHIENTLIKRTLLCLSTLFVYLLQTPVYIFSDEIMYLFTQIIYV